uniref:Reverse transcriptase domain-containing protein n=1 Tax=Sus scrofa TaxID=9823 RepID=A0A8D1AYR5_PIG
MFILTTVIQHSTGNPSHSNQRNKSNKRNPNRKRDVKRSLYPDDMIVYKENLKDSTPKLIELINKFSKVAGYNINIQKSVVFLYTNNKMLVKEYKNTIPFKIASQKIKYLGMLLTKEVKFY